MACEDETTPVPPEPPVGTWMRDRFGGVTMRQPGGWGQPGMMPFGKWESMWRARGPYVECGPWGADLPEPTGLRKRFEDVMLAAFCAGADEGRLQRDDSLVRHDVDSFRKWYAKVFLPGAEGD